MNIIPRDSIFNFGNLLDNVFTGEDSVQALDSGFFAPRVDIREKKGKYVIEAELPGVEKDDLDIVIDNGTLSIKAKTESETSEEEEGKVIRKERRFGSYQRQFYLGEGIDESKVKASFKNGVLKLQVPKPEQNEPEVKRIKVN